mgnify:CR=1 FL=1
MGTRVSLLAAWAAMGALSAGCRSPYYADRGAALGAVTGALTGAAIGEHSGEAGAGAAIGGAVGALTGAAIGDSIDRDIARSTMAAENKRGAVTVADVIAMTQSGLSEEVIVAHIRANGVAQPPQVADLIQLRDAGVSDRVVQAMQQATPRAVQVAPSPAPVVVEEHHYFAPAYPPYWRWTPHRPWPHRAPPHGFHWGISVGN